MSIIDKLFGSKSSVTQKANITESRVHGIGVELNALAFALAEKMDRELLQNLSNQGMDQRDLADTTIELILYKLAIGLYWIDGFTQQNRVTIEENHAIHREILAEFARMFGDVYKDKLIAWIEYLRARINDYKRLFFEDYNKVLQRQVYSLPFRKSSIEILKVAKGQDADTANSLEAMMILVGTITICSTFLNEQVIRMLKERNIL
jgi:hypothetical protein